MACAGDFAHPAHLLRRIETDAHKPNSPWRLEHLSDYDDAREWHSQEAKIVDTPDLQPRVVAKLIAAATDRTTTK
ncbi:hypothetical protein ACLMAL_34730 [Nocardia sp. CWNU-33]|uniref:hypothetical protein n=1 Tax=Nocardia sp. CWNU-33 TaxID=3392117 RepID=UPI00398F7A13